jgi:hypothetical protein
VAIHTNIVCQEQGTSVYNLSLLFQAKIGRFFGALPPAIHENGSHSNNTVEDRTQQVALWPTGPKFLHLDMVHDALPKADLILAETMTTIQ